MHAGGRLFGKAANVFQQLGKSLVDHGGQVAAVVENQVQRFAVGEENRLLNAPIELLFRFPFPGVDGDPRCCDGSGRVVLGREDVATAPSDVGAQLGERLDQHGRLDGHVQTTGDSGTGQRFAFAELLSQGHHARHLVLGQSDFLAAPLGQ